MRVLGGESFPTPGLFALFTGGTNQNRGNSTINTSDADQITHIQGVGPSKTAYPMDALDLIERHTEKKSYR